MRIIVRSGGMNLWLPLPLTLTSAAVNLLPEAVYADLRKSVPEPYDVFVSREFLRELVSESLPVLKQHKGLELVHVETQDGTYVSIKV